MGFPAEQAVRHEFVDRKSSGRAGYLETQGYGGFRNGRARGILLTQDARAQLVGDRIGQHGGRFDRHTASFTSLDCQTI